MRKFQTGIKVLVRNHVGKPKWLGGNIHSQVAPITYNVVTKNPEIPSKLTSRYDLKPNVITNIKGTTIAAKRPGNSFTGNSNTSSFKQN